MVHSYIGRVVEKYIGDEESCDALKGHLHGIESEVDNLANKESGKEDPDLDSVVKRAMELIKRQSPFKFFESNKFAIEKDIRDNLRDLEK
ncbi:MAG TPA: hypothetical protein ENH35_00835 [Candidatus Moranbacteria bacterium]|nr:hypothetical protein [Candidatus Moranbacteria bacterium]